MKIGDKVICISIHKNDLELHKIYIIEKLYYYSVSLIGRSGRYNEYQFMTLKEYRKLKLATISENVETR